MVSTLLQKQREAIGKNFQSGSWRARTPLPPSGLKNFVVLLAFLAL